MKKIKLIFILLCLLLCFNSCNSKNQIIEKHGFYFDTIITITLYGNYDEKIIDDCFSIAKNCEQLFSNTIPTSDISKINSNPEEFVTVDPLTLQLLEKALFYCEQSNGTFDITIGKLSELWNLSELAKLENQIFTETDLPTSNQIQSLLPDIDYHSIEINDHAVKLGCANCKLDLGGVAKGFIADRMKEFLVSQNVSSACINLGGNILTIGQKPNHQPFIIGIQKPFAERNETIAKLSVSDKSIVTSGIYERYIQVNDTIYHHILNPGTGYPIDNDLASVTIISEQSIDGDALSTICFLLGKEKGMDYINQRTDIEAIFITKENEILYSDHAKDLLLTNH